MKIALVHDYLSQDGGAERVLQSFHEIWPDAPIFVLFHDKKKMPEYSSEQIRESFLSKLPMGRKKYQWYLPLMPIATEKHNLHEFDVVLSSTSAFAKGVLTRPDTLHISYCHTPTRYLWTDTHEYIADLKYNFLIKSFLPRFIHKLRIWDRMSVDRVDHFIANSGTVKKRIKKYYRREADIIYPPVNTKDAFVLPKEKIDNYFLTGGRMVPYKRFDLLVQTFNRLGKNLIIFGEGPEKKRLQKLAKDNIKFIGRVSDEDKMRLLAGCKAFLHPQIEDFGITPVEAMACGRPVIAYPVGGVTETVIGGQSGEFFSVQSWESLFDIVLNFDHKKWDSQKIQNRAEHFSEKIFKEKIKRYVDNKYSIFRQNLEQCSLEVR